MFLFTRIDMTASRRRLARERATILGAVGHIGRRHHVKPRLGQDLLCPARRWCLRAEPPAELFSPTSFTAVITPLAMVSHFMMPPKMLMKMPRTAGSAVMILNAAVTFFAVAPPPTSRKLAGMPP